MNSPLRPDDPRNQRWCDVIHRLDLDSMISENDEQTKMSEFSKLEYQALREEIQATKDRLFKISAIALVGLPSVSAASDWLKSYALVIALPILVVATILLYLSESSALMGCGSYVKAKIEPSDGWEHWLSRHSERRRVDRLAFWFFITVFSAYYVVAAYLGIARSSVFGDYGPKIVTVVYSIVAIVGLGSIYRHYRLATNTTSG
jgi:hypothetical protein